MHTYLECQLITLHHDLERLVHELVCHLQHLHRQRGRDQHHLQHISDQAEHSDQGHIIVRSMNKSAEAGQALIGRQLKECVLSVTKQVLPEHGRTNRRIQHA